MTIKPNTLSSVVGFFAWTVVLWAGLALHTRWREETADRRVALAVDWNELRDFNARLAESDDQLLRELRMHGVTAVVLSPLNLSDLVQQRRVQALGGDFLNASRLRISDPALARQIQTQTAERKVAGLRFSQEGKTTVVSRGQGFAAMKDSDLGYDPALLKRLGEAGLTPIFRIFNDPWLSGAAFRDALTQLPVSAFAQAGVLMSSDDFPGGQTQTAYWKSWMDAHGVVQFLPELRPALSARLMALSFPANTFRAHTIPAAEQKDPATQMARWERALEERSNRLLLVRMGTADSRDSFFTTLTALNTLIERRGFVPGFPRQRLTWQTPTAFQKRGSPILAFLVVCIAPFAALRWARQSNRWTIFFFKTVAGCLLGALIGAAIAQTPLTRVQILPFRGVKAAFLFSWALSAIALYDWKELRALLSPYLRRRDLVIAAAALAALGYLLLRSGNAPAAWKPSWEQGFRDLLENILVARPRFKEFALGYPALWVGACLWYFSRFRRVLFDGRIAVVAGMIGPISMINTFCHLHSPLQLEVFRSFNGVLLGVLIGTLLLVGTRRWLVPKRPASFRLASDEDALAYQRSSS